MTITSLAELEPLLSDTRGTWLILDIDDTLIRVAGWGSDTWYYERVAFHRAAGLSERDAIIAGNDDWEKAQESINPEAVESDAPARVRAWQDRGLTVLGLTARRPEIAALTRRHLAAVGFDLARTAPALRSPIFIDGIVYVGPLAIKGEEIARLLPTSPPRRIVLTDDREEHIRSMAAYLKARGIAYEGRRFAAPAIVIAPAMDIA